ncbi:cilia- and flagella-associated protein 58 isoform X1 [Penaeus vannamei]|uniref:cilia- and flagella-associated protein 58 isoform X1 n=2 Tax=Penaeus vannamei TaxID=6689 RepID=UPI00387F5BC6
MRYLDQRGNAAALDSLSKTRVAMVTATLNPPWGQTCSRPSYESGVISTQEHFRGFSGISYRCFIGKEQREAMTETGEKEEEARSDAPVSVATSHAEGDETVTVEELEEQLKASQKETAKAREEISTLQQQLATSVPRAEALLARRDLERRIDTLVRDNQALTDSVEHEQREREWLEGELRAQYEAAESSEQEMMNLQTFVRNLHSLVEEKTRVIEVQKDERESITKQLEEGKEEVLRLRKEAEGRMRTLSRLESLYKDSSSLAKTREEEVTRLQKETSMAKRQYDQLEKTVRRQDQNRADVEGQVQNLRGQLKVAEKQALTEGRQVQKITRKVEKIKRERDVLHRTYVKTLGTVQKHAGLVHIRELERQNAERELARIRRDLGKQDALITALQHARDRQVEETARVESRVVDLAAEVEARGREVQRSLHTQAITRAHLQQATTLSEALKTDNFILGRQLRNVQTEKEEIVEESRKAGYQVKKLQQNLNTRDIDIQKLSSEIGKLERDKDQLRTAEKKAKDVADERHRTIQYAEGEKLGLTRILHDQEESVKTLNKDLEEERDRRGVVETQLARRNDEVRGLRERVHLLEHILHKGDKDYSNRLKDVNTLTTEVTALRDEREVLSRHVKLVESLKVELVRLQRELITSQNKRAVLEEEVIRRERAHRWTTLKASDPSTYDLLRKNQLLQKRLVAATQRAAASETEVAHKEREVEELRRMLERTTVQHPDVGATRSQLIHQLRAKDDQIKSVTAALNTAMLAQEEAEQERRQLKEQLAATRRRLNNLLRRQHRRSAAGQRQRGEGGGGEQAEEEPGASVHRKNGWVGRSRHS